MLNDLKANRCPNAQVVLNSILQSFISSNDNELVIRSIEPSLQRGLEARIQHYMLPIRIKTINKEPITEAMRTEWAINFDEEDYEDVTERLSFVIERKDVRC